MIRFAAAAARVTDALAIAFFVAMFACVLAQVVFRYFLGSPLTWSDELPKDEQTDQRLCSCSESPRRQLQGGRVV